MDHHALYFTDATDSHSLQMTVSMDYRICRWQTVQTIALHRRQTVRSIIVCGHQTVRTSLAYRRHTVSTMTDYGRRTSQTTTVQAQQTTVVTDYHDNLRRLPAPIHPRHQISLLKIQLQPCHLQTESQTSLQVCGISSSTPLSLLCRCLLVRSYLISTGRLSIS